MPVMFFVYLHAYLHVFTWYLPTFRKHTRRGKVSELAQLSMWAIHPSTWEQLKTWVNLKCGWIWGKNARNSIGRFANRPYNARKKPHANINDQWLITSVHWPLFTFHFSLFTFHCPLPSYFYSHFSQQFFLTYTSKMLYFCIEFKTGLRR